MSTFKLELAGTSCAVGFEERGVVEPFLVEALVGLEETNRAVEVVVTVEDEGLGELEGNCGFATTGRADEEEGLGESREEVGGGFHGIKRVTRRCFKRFGYSTIEIE